MAKQTSKPQSLRAVLGFLMAVVILGGGALFYFGLDTVRTFSIDVNHRLLDADASGQQIGQLQLLKNQLSESESLVNKADRLFATPNNYQSKTLTDLKNYASKTGLSIGSTDFEDPDQTGLYSVSVKLSQDVVDYSQLIKFLSYIEGNLPKMQVTSIELERANGGDADDVRVGTITINVSVR